MGVTTILPLKVFTAKRLIFRMITLTQYENPSDETSFFFRRMVPSSTISKVTSVDPSTTVCDSTGSPVDLKNSLIKFINNYNIKSFNIGPTCFCFFRDVLILYNFYPINLLVLLLFFYYYFYYMYYYIQLLFIIIPFVISCCFNCFVSRNIKGRSHGSHRRVLQYKHKTCVQFLHVHIN